MSHAPFAPRPHRKGAEHARADIAAKKPDADVPKLIDLRDELQEDEEEFIKDDGRILSLESALKKVKDAIEVYRASDNTPENLATIARLEVSQRSLQGALTVMRDELSELRKELEEVERDIRNIEESEKNNEILAAELRMSPEAPVSLIEAYEGYTHARALLETKIAKKGRELGMDGVRAMQEVITPFWEAHDAFFKRVLKVISSNPGGGLELTKADYPEFTEDQITPLAEAFSHLEIPGRDAKAVAEEVREIFRTFIKARTDLEAAEPKNLYTRLLALEEVAVKAAKIPEVWGTGYGAKELKAVTKAFEKAEQEIKDAYQPSLIEAERYLRGLIREQPQDLEKLADVQSEVAAPADRAAKKQEIQAALEAFVASMDRATALLIEKEGFIDGRNIIDALVGRVAEVRKAEKELRAKQELINATKIKVFEYLLKREMSSNPPSERQRLSTEWAAGHDRELDKTKAEVTKGKRELGITEAAIALREQTLKGSHKSEELEEIEALASFLESLAHLDSATAAEEVKAHAGLLSKIQKIEIDGAEYTGTKLLETVLAAGTEQPLRSVPEWLPGDLRNLSIGVAYHNRSGDPNRTVDPTDAIFGAYEFAREHAKKIERLLSLFEMHMQNPVARPQERSFLGFKRGIREKDQKAWDAWKGAVDHGIREILPEAQAALTALMREQAQLTTRTRQAASTPNNPETARLSAQLQAVKARGKALKDVVEALSPAVRNPVEYDANQLLILARASLEHVVQHLTGRGELTKDALKTVPDPTAFASLSQALEQAFVPPDMDELKKVFEKRRKELLKVINYAQQILPGRVRDGDEIGGPKIRKDLEDLQKPLDDLKVRRDAQQAVLDAATKKLADLQNETLETRLKAFDEETSREVTKLDPDKLVGSDEIRIQQQLETLAIRAEEEGVNLKNGLDVSAESYAEWLNGGARDPLTPQATEFEKSADASLRAEVAKLFAFFEANGAKSTMTRDQFNAWYNGLNVGVGAGMRVLIDALVAAHT